MIKSSQVKNAIKNLAVRGMKSNCLSEGDEVEDVEDDLVPLDIHELSYQKVSKDYCKRNIQRDGAGSTLETWIYRVPEITYGRNVITWRARNRMEQITLLEEIRNKKKIRGKERT